MGLILNIIVGIVGAYIGGFVMKLLGFDGVTGFNIWSVIVAAGGACILLWLLNVIKR